MGPKADPFWAADSIPVRQYWQSQFALASEFMRQRHGRRSILIEVAAQHPLVDGRRPNTEFKARLDRGKELYDQFVESVDLIELYVPGSRHVFRGDADELSLSEAGTTYLVEAGIPNALVHGEDLNVAYKADLGVYSSADECFVTASYFKDREFGRLVSVVSPAQLVRKTLHYAANGVLPMSYTAPTEVMFHDHVDEIFSKVPYVLFADHDLQGPESIGANSLRRERRPRT
jgi:hypothetical protein